MRRVVIALLVTLIGIVGLSAVGFAAEKFVVILGQATISYNEVFNTIVPQHLGYFKEEGLDVELQTSAGGIQGIQLLAAGRADVSLSSVPGLIQSRQKGIDVVTVYNYLRKHSTAIAVLADGPIKSPADLKGKNVGIVSMAATRTLDGKAMLKATGLDPEKDVKWLPVGFGAQAGAALMRGDVQALTLWDATYADIENVGVKLRYFTFPFQKDLIGYIYISTDKKVASRRQALIGFLRAVTKGTVFAQANPRAATCVYFEATGDLKTATDKNKTFQNALNIVNNNVANAELPTPTTLWGLSDAEAWKANEKYYRDLGIVEKELPATDYFVADRSFYEAINKFDAKAIQNQAKNYVCKAM